MTSWRIIVERRRRRRMAAAVFFKRFFFEWSAFLQLFLNVPTHTSTIRILVIKLTKLYFYLSGHPPEPLAAVMYMIFVISYDICLRLLCTNLIETLTIKCQLTHYYSLLFYTINVCASITPYILFSGHSMRVYDTRKGWGG